MFELPEPKVGEVDKQARQLPYLTSVDSPNLIASCRVSSNQRTSSNSSTPSTPSTQTVPSGFQVKEAKLSKGQQHDTNLYCAVPGGLMYKIVKTYK